MILRRFGWWDLWLLAGPVALQIPKDLDSITGKRLVCPQFSCWQRRDEWFPWLPQACC
jgi:hypothetical protein